jgi:ring-1,2-phenylacetyl-CoA epoxidase subunit PaaA
MSNDALRQAFLNAYLPKAEKYGLEIPDEPRIREEDGRYVVVEDDLDWDEFWTIAKNEYPAGLDQINGRANAQEAVEWVRESMETADAPAGTGVAAD